jgi:hypothetical protein
MNFSASGMRAWILETAGAGTQKSQDTGWSCGRLHVNTNKSGGLLYKMKRRKGIGRPEPSDRHQTPRIRSPMPQNGTSRYPSDLKSSARIGLHLKQYVTWSRPLDRPSTAHNIPTPRPDPSRALRSRAMVFLPHRDARVSEPATRRWARRRDGEQPAQNPHHWIRPRIWIRGNQQARRWAI